MPRLLCHRVVDRSMDRYERSEIGIALWRDVALAGELVTRQTMPLLAGIHLRNVGEAIEQRLCQHVLGVAPAPVAGFTAGHVHACFGT